MSKINDLGPADGLRTEIEPMAWAFQHDETGRWNVLVNDGINTPESFRKLNPRYGPPIPLYTWHAAIAEFLKRTGQYVTNDASREEAIAEATAELRAERDELQRLLTEARGPGGEEREEAFAEWLRGRGWTCTPPISSPPRTKHPGTF